MNRNNRDGFLNDTDINAQRRHRRRGTGRDEAAEAPYRRPVPPETEEKIEDILDSYEIPYEKSEYWIESEKMYEVLYQTEIIYGGN